MKKLTCLSTFIIMIILQINGYAQTKSCCAMNSTGDFAMLGKDADFRKAHLVPDPINFTPASGSEISFTTSDGRNGKGYLIKSEEKSKKFLFVIHEWWGLNDHIRKEAETLALALPGVNVIAIDLYDGKVATNADDAGKYMQEVKPERAFAILNGALQYAGTDSEIQTIGWCFGGGWSLQATILAGENSKGCVMYYGMPETDINKLEKIKSPVLGIFASKDGWINHTVVDAFENQMKSLHKPLAIKWYDADHAFANPSNPSKYDKDAAEDANKLAVAFLQKNF